MSGEAISAERPEGHYWVRFGAAHDWEVMRWDGAFFWGTAGDGYRGVDFEVGPQVFSPTQPEPVEPAEWQVEAALREWRSTMAMEGSSDRAMRAAIRAASLPKPQPAQVTDEMVERGCDSLFPLWRDRASWTQERMKKDMRAALIAALAGQEAIDDKHA